MLSQASLAELKDRILSRCEWQDGPLETPCLIWTGALSGHRGLFYGNIRYQGQSLRTHRVLWMCEYGEIEDGKDICHECDNPPCNNLLHLRVDTRAGNLGDAVRRGRLASGENHNRALLTATKVSHIKYFLQQGWAYTELARRYCTSYSAISNIKHGENWKHVQPFQPIPGEPLPVPPPLKLTAPIDRRFSAPAQQQFDRRF
jgi:hypothetical protein